jgi:hypothetical protein
VQNKDFYSRFFQRVNFYLPGTEDVGQPVLPPEPETPPDPVPPAPAITPPEPEAERDADGGN